MPGLLALEGEGDNMAQEATDSILSAFHSGSVQALQEALKSSPDPVQAVSAIVGRNVSPYKEDGNLIGGIRPEMFDETAYLIARLERWNERNS